VGIKLDEDGNKKTKISENFGKFSDIHGLKESALNYEFNHLGKNYKVLGYNTRSRKYSIEYSDDGVPYKCTPEYMSKIINQSAPESLFT
jgi:hypothetical protein